MSNIYDMSGKKKVIFTEDIENNITYKEIMKIVIENATEEICHQIFCYGGVNMCPSDVFGIQKINRTKEEENCEYYNIGCSKCWSNAIKDIKGGAEG